MKVFLSSAKNTSDNIKAVLLDLDDEYELSYHGTIERAHLVRKKMSIRNQYDKYGHFIIKEGKVYFSERITYGRASKIAKNINLHKLYKSLSGKEEIFDRKAKLLNLHDTQLIINHLIVRDPTQQKLKEIHIHSLKNIKDLEISFNDEKRLTAIMGSNGTGKSTILHALACCYKPLRRMKTEDYHFSFFFTPTNDSPWTGSALSIVSEERTQNNVHLITKKFTKPRDRWVPKYNTRPARYVIYIGIVSSVPSIELEKSKNSINYSTIPMSDEVSNVVKIKASYILNRDYSSYNLHETKKSTYIGVELGKIKYSALSMSAGEQRVFKIIAEILKAPKYSLLLIDEIDLLLHPEALKKLILVLNELADQKKLQVIFTTHSPVVIELNETINIKHIFNTAEKTLCFNETKPEAVFRLTGQREYVLEVFVEDDLSKAIVEYMCELMDIKPYVSVKMYGAAINCFTLVGGMLLQGEKDIDKSILVLDGDVYTAVAEKEKHLNKVITGNTHEHKKKREQALSQIYQFNLPDEYSPEKYIWSLIRGIELPSDSNTRKIKETCMSINMVSDSHEYVNEIIKSLGYGREIGLYKVIKAASESAFWEEYIEPVSQWLMSKKSLIVETASVIK